MQKGFVIIPILIGILVIGGVVGAWYTKLIQIPGFAPPGCYYKQVQCIQAPCKPILVCDTPSPSPVVTSQAIPSPSPVADETANWKTYTNKYYGFSLKYPDKYKVRDVGDINYIGKKVFIEYADSQYPDAFTINVDWDNGSKGPNAEFQKSFQDYLSDRAKGWCDASGVEGSTECDRILQQDPFYTDSGLKGIIIYLNQVFKKPDGATESQSARGPIFAFEIYTLTNNTAKALFIEPTNGKLNQTETHDLLEISKTLTFQKI